MKTKYAKGIIFISAMVVVVILGFVCSTPTLIKQRYRNSEAVALDEQLKSDIRRDTKTLAGFDLVNYSLRLTAKRLQFSTGNDIEKGQANCVGYARLCSTIFNYACKVNHIKGCYSQPVVGTVKIAGLDLCCILKAVAPKKWKGFVKDHDFVQFNIDNTVVYADPTSEDMLHNPCTTFNSQKE